MPMLPVRANDDTTHIEIKVDYDKGGNNYFHGAVDARGIWLYVHAVILKDGRKMYPLTRGGRVLLEKLRRINKYVLSSWQLRMERDVGARSGPIWDSVLKICRDHRLEPEPPASEMQTARALLGMPYPEEGS